MKSVKGVKSSRDPHLPHEHDPDPPGTLHSSVNSSLFTAFTINFKALEAHNHSKVPHLFLEAEDLDDRMEPIKNSEGELEYYLFRCLFTNLKFKDDLLSVITTKDLDGKKSLVIMSKGNNAKLVPTYELVKFPLRFREIDKATKLQNPKDTNLLIVPASHKEIKLFSCLPETIAMKFETIEKEEADLYSTIRTFCAERWGVMRDVFLDVVSCYVLASWVREIPPAVGVLVSTGKPGTGKSVLIQIMEEIGFLGVDLASITGPAIGFVDENYHPFLLHDECQNLNSTKNPDIGEKIALINSRYKHKAKRVKMSESEKKGGPRGIDVQRLFGFCALAGTELPTALGIRDRAILLPAMYSTPQKVIDDEDSLRACAYIRSRALAFRSQHLFDDFSTYRSEFDRLLEGCAGRIREIAYAILFVAKICAGDGNLQKLVEFFKSMDAKKKAESAVGELADVVHAYFDVLLELWRGEPGNNVIFVSNLLEKLNLGRVEKDMMSAPSLGLKLATLGFVTDRQKSGENKGRKWILYDADLLKGHAATYNVELPLELPPELRV